MNVYDFDETILYGDTEAEDPAKKFYKEYN